MQYWRKLNFMLGMLLALTAPPLCADSVEQINAKSLNALVFLRDYVEGSDELVRSAAGVLVFPDVVKMGFGVGGQYGEGVLLVGGKPDGYYSTAGASFGLQLGAQFKSEVILFLTQQSLDRFRDSHGWEIGVDGSVALLHKGAGARLDTRTLEEPVVGFIFSNEGLMGNLTLEGARITRLAR